MGLCSTLSPLRDFVDGLNKASRIVLVLPMVALDQTTARVSVLTSSRTFLARVLLQNILRQEKVSFLFPGRFR